MDGLMGKKLVLQGVKLTGPDAPVLPDIDPIESTGSLLLFDWTHPANTLPADVVPAHDSVLPNLLQSKADALTGGPAHLLAGYPSVAAETGLFERSGKGGMHGVVSPTLAKGPTHWRGDGNDALNQYFIDNPFHEFYFSVWGFDTKPATGGVRGVRAEVTRTVTPSHNTMLIMSDSHHDRVSPAGIGPALYQKSASYWENDSHEGATPSNTRTRLVQTGTSSGYNYMDTQRQQQGGFIHYRTYVEDLTISGRSYQEVSDLDSSLFTAAVLTPGGRYHGDTFTDPTTVP